MKKNGFVLVELMTVIAILGILASYATPKFANIVAIAKARQCQYNRNLIENSANRYFIDKALLNPSIQTLVDTGYIKTYPKCSAGGTYVWQNPATPDSSFRKVGCSIHYIVVSSTGT